MAKFALKTDAIINGGLAGLGSDFGARILGPALGPGAATMAIGAWRGDDWTQRLGGYQLGRSLAAMVNLPGTLLDSPGAGAGGGGLL